MAIMGPEASLMDMLPTMLARVEKAMLHTMYHSPLHMAMHRMGDGHMAMDHYTTSQKTWVMDQDNGILLPLMVAKEKARKASQPMVAASLQTAGAKEQARPGR